MPDLSDFRFSLIMPVRFADCDGMGHVNNAKYFTYMEMARIIYMREVAKLPTEDRKPGMILAHISCDYRSSLVFGDEVEIFVRVTRIGRSSFDFGYILRRVSDEVIVAEGESVQVVYDYDQEQSQPIPDEWRGRFIRYEPSLSG